MKKKIWIPILSIFAGLALLGAGIGVGVLIPRTTATIKPNWEKPFWVKINDWEINKNAVENVNLLTNEQAKQETISGGIIFDYNLGNFIEHYKITFSIDSSDHSKDILNLQNILNKDSKEKELKMKTAKLYLNDEYLKNI